MHRKSFLLILAVLVCFQIAPLYKQSLSKIVSSTTDCDWPAWGKSAGHDRVADSSCGPDPRRLTKFWEYKVDDVLCSSASIWDGKLFMGTEKRELCLDAKTGTLIWESKTDSKTWSPPSIENNLLYMGVDDGRILCLQTSNGQNLWEFKTEGAIIRSPSIDNGKAFVGSKDKKFYCLDAYTGRELWSFLTEGEIACSASIINGFVYFVSSDKKVYCLKEANGAKLWDLLLPDVSVTSVAFKNNKLFVGCNDGNLYCINPITGSIAWSYKTEGAVRSCPAVEDGMVYIGSDDSFVHAIKYIDNYCYALWKYKTSDKVYSSPAICSDYVYVGSDDKSLYCLNKTSGEMIFSDLQGDQVWGSPTIALKCVYIGSASNSMVCYGNKGFTCDWPSFGKTQDNGRQTSPECGPNVGKLGIKWKFETGARIHSSPVISDDKLICGSDDGYIYCLDAKSGKLLWNLKTNSYIDSTPTIDKKKVYVTGNDGILRCFDIDNGNIIWQFDQMSACNTCPVIVNDRLFFGAGAKFYCLNANNGNKIWLCNLQNDIITSTAPAISYDSVFFGTDHGNVISLYLENGNERWRSNYGGLILSGLVVLGNYLYTASTNGKIICQNPTNGQSVWTYETTYQFCSSPAINDKCLLISSTDGQMFCLNRITGSKIWQLEQPNAISSVALAGYRGYIRTSSDCKLLYFDARDGNKLSTFESFIQESPYYITSSPSICYNNVYVTFNHTIMCLGDSIDYPVPPPEPPAPPDQETLPECTKCKKYMLFKIGSKEWAICDELQQAMSAPPELKSGRSFLVVKYIADIVGAQIKWNDSTKVTQIVYPAKNVTISLQIGNNVAYVNGESKYIDPNNLSVKPYISNGRTMLPLRFLAENLNLDIQWFGYTQRIVVLYDVLNCDQTIDFTLNDTESQEYSLSSYRGKPVLLIFTASWCGYCKLSIPALKAIARKYGNQIQLLAINASDDLETARNYKQDQGMTWPMLLDSNNGVSNKFNVDGIPHFVLIDKNGNAKFIQSGYNPSLESILSSKINELLN